MGVTVFWFHMGAWKMNLEVCFWCALYLVEALFLEVNSSSMKYHDISFLHNLNMNIIIPTY